MLLLIFLYTQTKKLIMKERIELFGNLYKMNSIYVVLMVRFIEINNNQMISSSTISTTT